jgi:hypothetical protein
VPRANVRAAGSPTRHTWAKEYSESELGKWHILLEQSLDSFTVCLERNLAVSSSL